MTAPPDTLESTAEAAARLDVTVDRLHRVAREVRKLGTGLTAMWPQKQGRDNYAPPWAWERLLLAWAEHCQETGESRASQPVPPAPPRPVASRSQPVQERRACGRCGGRMFSEPFVTVGAQGMVLACSNCGHDEYTGGVETPVLDRQGHVKTTGKEYRR